LDAEQCPLLKVERARRVPALTSENDPIPDIQRNKAPATPISILPDNRKCDVAFEGVGANGHPSRSALRSYFGGSALT
jgi:hypothetical protein